MDRLAVSLKILLLRPMLFLLLLCPVANCQSDSDRGVVRVTLQVLPAADLAPVPLLDKDRHREDHLSG